MLIGTVEILQDIESKKMLWIDGAEVYYPLGVGIMFHGQTGQLLSSIKEYVF